MRRDRSRTEHLRRALARLLGMAALLAVVAVPLAAGAAGGGPSVRGVSISLVNEDETTYATVTGARFASGATVSLGRGIRCQVQSVDPTRIAVRLVVESDAGYGPRTLTVTNPDGQSGSLARAMHVDYAPVFEKWAVGQGAVDWSTTLVRPTFVETPTLDFSGTGVTVVAETLETGGTLAVGFSVARTAPATWRSMTITEGLASWTVANGLKVRAAPTVTSVTPLGPGATDQGVKVRGANFEVCPTKEPSLSIAGPGVTVDAVSAALGDVMYATLTVADDAPLGPRAVTVTNCDSGGTSTTPGAFSVFGPPKVTAVPPIALGVRRTETFSGVDLTPATSLSASGSGVTIDHVQYVSPTRLRATIAVAATAGLGPHDVTATDAGGVEQTTASGLLVVDPDPTATSLSQAGIGANTTVHLLVHGSGFEHGAAVVLDDTSPQGPYLEEGVPALVSASELAVNVTALDDTPLSTVHLTVENPDGGTTAPLSLSTNPGPVLTVASSTTTVGALVVSFEPAEGAPAAEPYALRLCEDAALTSHCLTRTSITSPTTLHGLSAGRAYWAQLTAPASAGFALAASLVVGPRRATVQLLAPTVLSVWSSTTTPSAIRVTFRHPSNAPGTTRYEATACRNAAMTSGCVADPVTSGAQVTGLVAGRTYHLTVTALAAAGALAATSRPSRAVPATVQLAAPTLKAATLHHDALKVRFLGASGAPHGQRYTLLVCADAALRSGCVSRQGYRSGESVTVHLGVAYVRVTAAASKGYLAASSPTVRTSS